MASAWGDAFGAAWGDSCGTRVVPPTPPPTPAAVAPGTGGPASNLLTPMVLIPSREDKRRMRELDEQLEPVRAVLRDEDVVMASAFALWNEDW